MEQDLFDLTFETTLQALSGAIHNKDWLASWRANIESLREARRQYHDALQQVLIPNPPKSWALSP